MIVKATAQHCVDVGMPVLILLPVTVTAPDCATVSILITADDDTVVCVVNVTVWVELDFSHSQAVIAFANAPELAASVKNEEAMIVFITFFIFYSPISKCRIMYIMSIFRND